MKKVQTQALALALVALGSVSWASTNLNSLKSDVYRLAFENNVASSTQPTAMPVGLDNPGKGGKMAPQTITICKKTIPPGGTGFPFNWANGFGTLPSFPLDDGQCETKDVTNQDHFNKFTENVPPGWTLTNIACTYTKSAVKIIGANANPAFQPGDNTVTIDLSEANVTCTFVNQRHSSGLATSCEDDIKSGQLTITAPTASSITATSANLTGSVSVASILPGCTYTAKLVWGPVPTPPFPNTSATGSIPPSPLTLTGTASLLNPGSGYGARIEVTKQCLGLAPTVCNGPIRFFKTLPGGQGNATICVLKFADKNGNGRQDPGELALPGWTFQIAEVPSGNIVATITTGGPKKPCADVPAPGTYTVTEQPVLSGWTPTTPNPQTVTVSPDQTWNLIFGNKKKRVVGEGVPVSLCRDVTINLNTGQAAWAPGNITTKVSSWVTPVGGASWIQPSSLGTPHAEPSGDYQYTVLFSVPPPLSQYSSIQITGQYAADNEVEFFLNGPSTGVLCNPANHDCFAAWRLFLPLIPSSAFATSNTLTAKVHNEPNHNATGLIVNAELQAICKK